MSTSGVNSTNSSNQTQQSTDKKTQVPDRLENMDIDMFLKLLTTELQSQDPTEPMKNSELIQQVSQIRAIESNTKLTETLESVMLGQNMSTASGLLGRTITGLSDDEKRVEGVVDKITVAGGKTVLHIGSQTVSLNNVDSIIPTKTSK